MKLHVLFFSLYIFFAYTNFAQAKEPPLEVMIGEMILVGFEGHSISPDAPILQALKENKVGGVILFDRDATTGEPRNIISPAQTKKLITQLQECTENKIFIALDQEGGKVQRLSARNGFQNWLSAKELGKLSGAEVRNSAFAMGKILADLGFNLNFAPVVDLDYPNSAAIGRYNRAFSHNPYKVFIAANEFIQGMQDAGIISVLKHFPGHGSSQADTHNSFADVSRTWTKKELLPYQAFINNDFQGMIMTAHISMDKLNYIPATLSPLAINGLLRQKLGWNGVVITDDVQMKAIRKNYNLTDTIYLAVQAGVDIIIIGNNLLIDDYTAQRAHKILLTLVKSGRISEERIRRSWQRINNLKRLLL